MAYNKRTLRSLLGLIFGLTISLVVLFLIAVSTPHPPRDIFERTEPFDTVIVLAPPGTGFAFNSATGLGGTAAQVWKTHKLEERFVRAWPKGLKIGVPDTVTVRIAANKYEDLLAGINRLTQDIKQEEFKGEPRIEVTLTGDSGLEIVKQHSDQQVVVKNEQHKEWNWLIIPKAPGKHVLSLLVEGIRDNVHYDLDPDAKEYDVAFNWWYWFCAGTFQNGVSWIWTAFWAVVVGVWTYLWTKRTERRKAKQTAPPLLI